MDSNNYYTGQVVNEGDLDQIYTDAQDMEQGLATGGGFSQLSTNPLKFGGVNTGLVVTKNTATVVDVTIGEARDSQGRRIALPSAATVSLANVGDTDEGDVSNALGDGTGVSGSIGAGQEAWLSLFLVYDENLSDQRQDSLGNTIDYRRAESFHFNIGIGTPAALGSATGRVATSADKILLCDILVDENGEIRNIDPGSGAYDAICASSKDFNRVGYGLDDTPNMAGRRGDWASLDADGTDYDAWKDIPDASENNSKAYFSIRKGDSRQMADELASVYAKSSASEISGSQIVGARQVTGKTLTQAAEAALQMGDDSVHKQIEATVDRVNNKVDRGGATDLAGDFLPDGNGTRDLGDATHRWNVYISTLDVASVSLTDLDVTGTLTLTGEVDSDFLPDTGSRNLGSLTNKWQNLFIGGNANIDGIIENLTSNFEIRASGVGDDMIVKANSPGGDLLLEAIDGEVDVTASGIVDINAGTSATIDAAAGDVGITASASITLTAPSGLDLQDGDLEISGAGHDLILNSTGAVRYSSDATDSWLVAPTVHFETDPARWTIDGSLASVQSNGVRYTPTLENRALVYMIDNFPEFFDPTDISLHVDQTTTNRFKWQPFYSAGDTASLISMAAEKVESGTGSLWSTISGITTNLNNIQGIVIVIRADGGLDFNVGALVRIEGTYSRLTRWMP